MGLSKEARRLENDSDSVVKVGCAKSRQLVGAFPGAAARGHVCFVQFLKRLVGRVRGGAWLFRFQDRSTQVATTGVEIPFSIRRRMRTRWLHSTCCRVAAFQWRSSRHGTGVVGGVADKWCLSVR